ncbi:MAG: hypothetical protein ACI915_003954 [Gammaproteobacteria bacterium]
MKINATSNGRVFNDVRISIPSHDPNKHKAMLLPVWGLARITSIRPAINRTTVATGDIILYDDNFNAQHPRAVAIGNLIGSNFTTNDESCIDTCRARPDKFS